MRRKFLKDTGDASGIKRSRRSRFRWTGTSGSDAWCIRCIPGKEIDYSAIEASAGTKMVKPSEQAETEIKFGYCTEFIIMLEKNSQRKMRQSSKHIWSLSEILSYA